MPGKARGYTDFYNNRDEMPETIVPRTRSKQQEAAILHSKQRKGVISKDALRRRLSKVYSK